MLVGRLFGYFRERNQELNSAHFPGAEDDPWRPYRTLIKELQRGASTVVDLGAGPVDACKEWLGISHSPASESTYPIVVSLDQDRLSLRRNPGKHRVLADARCLPFRENSVDLLLSRYTLEHVPDPLLMIKRSEEHTSELQSPCNLVCRLLLEKKKNKDNRPLTLNISFTL